jgi:hypothetical protein
MQIDERGIKGLAIRGVDLWINLEITKFKNPENYQKVSEVLKKRFKTEKLSPLLVFLGLLEMALIDDALGKRPYVSEEEREEVIKDIVSSLAQKFPEIVKEAQKLVSEVESVAEEFLKQSKKYLEEK